MADSTVKSMAWGRLAVAAVCYALAAKYGVELSEGDQAKLAEMVMLALAGTGALVSKIREKRARK